MIPMPKSHGFCRAMQGGGAIRKGDAMPGTAPTSDSLLEAWDGGTLGQKIGYQHRQDSADISFVDALSAIG